MGKNSTSQWDFGDLFDPVATRRVITVAELTATVRRLLERELRQVWVTGEVTNLRVQSSGHIYFTLKDSLAQLQCVLFRGERVENRELLQDGQKMILLGDVTVYEPRGQYQLRVQAIELQGVGALQAAFERLKKKLQAEGLFAPERKRPLPPYPQRVGLVTSPTGAAIRDVLHVLERRHPALELILTPCRVQGEGAAEEIAASIRLLNEWSAAAPDHRIDLILVTRGGGSLEDLWAFNEEVVARAIFESQVPLVSAVGHEIDFTISDFVADLRAATPSAAAEIITDGLYRSREFIAQAAQDLRQAVRRRVADESRACHELRQRLVRLHPRRVLEERSQFVDDLQLSLVRCARRGWREQENRLVTQQQRLARLRPSLLIGLRRQTLLELGRRLQQQADLGVEQWRQRAGTLQARLRLLGPENTLARGYSITTDSDSGTIIRQADQVRPGQRLRTRVQAGTIQSVVEHD